MTEVWPRLAKRCCQCDALESGSGDVWSTPSGVDSDSVQEFKLHSVFFFLLVFIT